MHKTKTGLTRSLYNITFAIASLVTLLTVILGAGFQMLIPSGASEGLSSYYHSVLVEKGLSSDAMLMLVPILCTLPYTTAFLEDYTSGYLRFYILRSEKEAYIKGKLLAVFLSGGLCLFVGIITVYFLLYLIYSPKELLDTEGISPFLGVPAWFVIYEVTFDGSIKQDYVLALNAIDGGRIMELPVDLSGDIRE